MLEELVKLAEDLDKAGFSKEADLVDDVIKMVVAKKKKKWMQEAVKRPGKLSKEMGVAESKNISIADLEARKKRLQKQIENKKERGESTKELVEKLQRVQFALNAKRR